MSVPSPISTIHAWSNAHRFALWLINWLSGVAATDDVIDACITLYGKPQNVSEITDALRNIRRSFEAVEAPDGSLSGFPISVAMSAPGIGATLPDTHPWFSSAQATGAAIVVPWISDSQLDDRDTGYADFSTEQSPFLSGHHQEESAILIPGRTDGISGWQLGRAHMPSALDSYCSPGEADLALSMASRHAADLIESRGTAVGYFPSGAGVGLPSSPERISSRGPSPRLVVGQLADAYDESGFPPGIDNRCARLCVRADSLSAIIEAVHHEWDEALMPLLRPVRQARIASVQQALVSAFRIR